jgi:hypothetical protein
MVNGVDLLAINALGKNGKVCEDLYAFRVVKELYSNEELIHGLFPDPNGRSFKSSKTPLDDEERLFTLKEAICKRFGYDFEEQADQVWARLRSGVNKRLRGVTKKDSSDWLF